MTVNLPSTAFGAANINVDSMQTAIAAGDSFNSFLQNSNNVGSDFSGALTNSDTSQMSDIPQMADEPIYVDFLTTSNKEIDSVSLDNLPNDEKLLALISLLVKDNEAEQLPSEPDELLKMLLALTSDSDENKDNQFLGALSEIANYLSEMLQSVDSKVAKILPDESNFTGIAPIEEDALLTNSDNSDYTYQSADSIEALEINDTSDKNATLYNVVDLPETITETPVVLNADGSGQILENQNNLKSTDVTENNTYSTDISSVNDAASAMQNPFAQVAVTINSIELPQTEAEDYSTTNITDQFEIAGLSTENYHNGNANSQKIAAEQITPVIETSGVDFNRFSRTKTTSSPVIERFVNVQNENQLAGQTQDIVALSEEPMLFTTNLSEKATQILNQLLMANAENTPVANSTSAEQNQPLFAMSGLKISSATSETEELTEILTALNGKSNEDKTAENLAGNFNAARTLRFNSLMQSQSSSNINSLKESVAEQLGNRINAELRPLADGEKEFIMTLTPENLGKITVKLVTLAGKISVDVTAEKQETASLLADRSSNLAEAVKASGVEMTRYTVNYEPAGQPNNHDYGDNQNSQNNQNQKQEQENNQQNSEDDSSDYLNFSELLAAL